MSVGDNTGLGGYYWLPGSTWSINTSITVWNILEVFPVHEKNRISLLKEVLSLDY